VPATPPPVAAELALAAAKASGLDLVGVDLLPTGPGGFSVIELNGAVDFLPVYGLVDGDVHAHAMIALAGGKTVPETAFAQIS
jgi:glutathione synthase/RimK-type ligase-like ATP-grasp enzyme